MTFIELTPVTSPVRGVIRPPGSKSITNRAMVMAALVDGPLTMTGVLDSQDTRVMVESLRRLGFTVDQDLAACRCTVRHHRSAAATDPLPSCQRHTVAAAALPPPPPRRWSAAKLPPFLC